MNLEMTSVTLLLASYNQSVASESERARHQCKAAVVTPPVNLGFSYQSRVSRHLIELIAIDS